MPFFEVSSALMLSIVTSISLAFGFIILLYTQALVRNLYINNKLKKTNLLFALSVNPFRRSDRYVIFVFPIIGIATSIIRNKAFTYSNMASLAVFAAFVIVIEVLFLIHSKSMKIFVTNKGFVIKGLDLRMELPVPTHYQNASGYYPYNKIDAFLMLDGSIQLYHHYDIGIISIPCVGDEAKQIKGLLVANKIPDKRF
jgi:hypothetical protein